MTEWNGEGCEECGDDDGPHRYQNRWWCMDCLERCHPGDPATDVVVEPPAVDPDKVDPVLLPRLGGFR